MKLEGAIFDLDGTLLDSMGIWEKVPNLYLSSKGLPESDTLHKEISVLGLEASAEYVGKKYNIPDSPQTILADIIAIVGEFYRCDAELKEGAAEFLRTIWEKGVKICVATATDKELAKAALERCGVLKYISNILTCDELETTKQVPLIYRTALDILGTEKDRTVIFEDAYYAAKTAKDDGFTVCGIYDKSESEDIKTLCDYYIENYNEAGEIFD
ncbi:MAG: HAD family phosphatase [Clostridia bacterium]|nr:HAD family phosphatase [Clostridia bacterium]